jgi:hypothetical protein
MIAVASTEIQMEHLRNTILDHYRCSNPLGEISCYWIKNFATIPYFLKPCGIETIMYIKLNWTPRSESASELYYPSDRRLSAKLVPTFTDRKCHVVSVTDSYGRILGFLDRSRYFFFQTAPQLYSRGWVNPVPDPLLLRKSDNAGN